MRLAISREIVLELELLGGVILISTTDDCCKTVKTHNVTLPHLQELYNNVNLESLELVSHKLDEINKMTENFNKKHVNF